MKHYFESDKTGKLKEYVGSKAKYNEKEGWMKLTQLVLIQSFEDEFNLPKSSYKTAGTPGKSDVKLNEEEYGEYRKGVSKLINLADNSRLNILNPVREVARHGLDPSLAHMNEVLQIMRYCVDTKEYGLFFNPYGEWDGTADFFFNITGRSDSTYGSRKDTMMSVSGWSCEIIGA